MDADTKDIIVHGKYCANWREPDSVEDWLALEFVWEKVDRFTYGRCPACGEVVFIQSDERTIDFGVEQPDFIKENAVVIETFIPLVNPK